MTQCNRREYAALANSRKKGKDGKDEDAFRNRRLTPAVRQKPRIGQLFSAWLV
jgi:hypothetical protein